jgi:hypothetical protein
VADPASKKCSGGGSGGVVRSGGGSSLEEVLGALLCGATVAVHLVAVGVADAPVREHGPIQRERRLVEPQPLDS